MRAALRSVATLLLFCTLASAQAKSGAVSPPATAQKPAAAARRGVPSKPGVGLPGQSECLESFGFCISVPVDWRRVGEIFDGLGFVTAEPHAGTDPAAWPQLTVAAIEVSAKEADDSTKPSLDALVERMLTPEGALASAHVLERTSLLLNGANAQIVRVGFPEEAGSAEAIETVALIEGEEGLVYSVALRCSPPDVNRLDPVFRQAIESWRLENTEASSTAPASAPPNPTSVQPKAALSNPEIAEPQKIKP